MTSRELLVDVAGTRHIEHTIVRKGKPDKGIIAALCSCGLAFDVAATPENVVALAMVPGEPS